jgi:hypothetical protein
MTLSSIRNKLCREDAKGPKSFWKFGCFFAVEFSLFVFVGKSGRFFIFDLNKKLKRRGMEISSRLREPLRQFASWRQSLS